MQKNNSGSRKTTWILAFSLASHSPTFPQQKISHAAAPPPPHLLPTTIQTRGAYLWNCFNHFLYVLHVTAEPLLGKAKTTCCHMSEGVIYRAAERLDPLMLLYCSETMQRVFFFSLTKQGAVTHRLIQGETTHPKVTRPVTVSKHNKHSSSSSSDSLLFTSCLFLFCFFTANTCCIRYIGVTAARVRLLLIKLFSFT